MTAVTASPTLAAPTACQACGQPTTWTDGMCGRCRRPDPALTASHRRAKRRLRQQKLRERREAREASVDPELRAAAQDLVGRIRARNP